jgi:hypothetical protein
LLHQKINGVEGIENKMRVDLGFEHFQLRFKAFLFQLCGVVVSLLPLQDELEGGGQSHQDGSVYSDVEGTLPIGIVLAVRKKIPQYNRHQPSVQDDKSQNTNNIKPIFFLADQIFWNPIVIVQIDDTDRTQDNGDVIIFFEMGGKKNILCTGNYPVNHPKKEMVPNVVGREACAVG